MKEASPLEKKYTRDSSYMKSKKKKNECIVIEIRKVVISGRKGILIGRRMGALPKWGGGRSVAWLGLWLQGCVHQPVHLRCVHII